ncbi:hypothetical protein [Sulfurimonas diazotrophicus]|uniref:Uncharacterized protein n=1 Tax=Sulfurimonas diazotrophicus TaxID=3131939 RepID=A0ABZ3HCW0_9BACT
MDKEKSLILEYVEDEYKGTIPEKNKKNAFLGYGQTGEDEDFLVGTEESLKNLIKACQTALEKGECEDFELGKFAGVKLVDESYYHEDKETFIGKLIGSIIMTLILSSMIVGFVTILKWLF